MPGFLLHEGATVTCLHAGQAEPIMVNPRVTVGGQPTVQQPTTYAVAGCILPPPPSGNGPCVTASWITAATRVSSGGMPLLLADSQAVCVPTGTGLLVLVTQLRVRAT